MQISGRRQNRLRDGNPPVADGDDRRLLALQFGQRRINFLVNRGRIEFLRSGSLFLERDGFGSNICQWLFCLNNGDLAGRPFCLYRGRLHRLNLSRKARKLL